MRTRHLGCRAVAMCGDMFDRNVADSSVERPRWFTEPMSEHGEHDGERIDYDEFAYFAENAAEFGIPYAAPPVVERVTTTLGDGRTMSALRWGATAPRAVLIHGGAQNAHTWDTVALALNVPLLAPDLPGHGHSGRVAIPAKTHRSEALAADVATVLAEHAPHAEVVVGMSLGGLTALALAAARPELVKRLVLVDITPGVDGAKAQAITDFVRGPATFDSFDALLARTIEHNPTRSESSLRRGILHNAVQRDDGTWVWRYRRDDTPFDDDRELRSPAHLWDTLEALQMPLMLVRGTRAQSVIDDADEAELRRRQPRARVEHVDAGHSVQGDRPVELAALIADFAGFGPGSG